MINFDAKTIQALTQSENLAIFCHQRPDGDAVGSSLSLKHALERQGKKVDVFCDDFMPDTFNFLRGYESYNKKTVEKYDTVIIVDCSDLFRIGRFASEYEKHNNIICIDHHKTNEYFAKYNAIDSGYASTCEIVYELLCELNIEIDIDIAECLYTGLSTDTGNFMHANTTSATLEKASKLVAVGIDISKIMYPLYKSVTKGRNALLGRVLTGAKYFCDDKICILTVSLNSQEGIETHPDITSGFVDYSINVESCIVGVCLLQADRHTYKISMRSKGNYDCSDVCAQFGGGGHKNASGCVLCGYYEDVIDKLVKAISDRF